MENLNTNNTQLSTTTQFVIDGTSKMVDGASAMLRRITSDEQNVAQVERVVSGLIGLAIATVAIDRLAKQNWFTGSVALASGGGLIYRALTGHCKLYDAIGKSTFKEERPHSGVKAEQGVRVEKSITVQRPANELFQYWRNLENLPRIMSHLESVETASDKLSHWVAKAPAGLRVEWDAEIINERENELLAWKSVEGSQVDNAGSVRFREIAGGRGTEVKVSLKYDPPGGAAGVVIAKLFGRDAAAEIESDLSHFKQFMEAGEVSTTTGQTSARPTMRTH